MHITITINPNYAYTITINPNYAYTITIVLKTKYY